MKKIVSVVLAIAMFCSMATLVSAANDKPNELAPINVYNYEELAVKRDGKEVQYDDLQQFSEGYAAVEFENGKWRYVDEKGNESTSVIPGSSTIDSFAYATPYKDGKALVGEISEGKLFLKYRKDNGECIELKKDGKAYYTSDWGAYFEGATGINNYADCDIIPYAYNGGHICLPEEDHYAIFGDNGVFIADSYKVDKKEFFVSDVVSEGYVTLCAGENESLSYILYNIVSKEPLAIEGMDGNTYKVGEVEYKVSKIYPFTGGLACVSLEKGEEKFFAVVDKEGDVSNIVPCQEMKTNELAGSKGETPISDGVIVYQKTDGKWNFACIRDQEKTAPQIIPNMQSYSSNESLSTYVNGVMLAKDGGKYGVINKDGQKLLDFKYSGRIYDDGTLLMIDQAYKYHFFIAENGALTEIKIYDSKAIGSEGFMYHKDLNDKLFNTLHGIYMGNAGVAGNKADKFIFIEKNGKYSYAKLVKDQDKTDKYNKNEQIEPLHFTDAPEGAWYYDDLRLAYERGIINGKTATEFKPDDNMTYAEAIKLAACLHQLYYEGNITLVNGNPWYKPYYDYCERFGIIAKGGTYPHNEKITRAGYMVIFRKTLPDRYLEAINYVDNNYFADVEYDPSDDDKNGLMEESIYILCRAGIVVGSTEEAEGSPVVHKCYPGAYIKRSEVAAVITRMLFKDKRVVLNKDSGKPDDEGTTNKPMAIKVQPKSVEVEAGQEVKLSVEVEGGSGEYTYQWSMVVYGQSVLCVDEEGVMQGVTTDTLTINKANAEATFYCMVKDKEKSDEDGIKTEAVTVKIIAKE